jgi:hypothetical protein
LAMLLVGSGWRCTAACMYINGENTLGSSSNGQQGFDLLQLHSSRRSRAARSAAAYVVIFFFTNRIHTFSTCICGAVLSALQLCSALRQVLFPLSPLQTAAHPGKGLALPMVFLMLRRQHPASCTAGGEGCAAGPRATTWMLSVSLCAYAWNAFIDCAAATCLSRLAGTPCRCY